MRKFDSTPATHPEHLSCPVCSANALRVGPSFSVDRAVIHFCRSRLDEPTFRNAMYRCLHSIWPEGAATIYGCPECEFGFAYPHVGGSSDLYSLLNDGGVYPAWRVDYDLALEATKGKNIDKVLDVGGGDGNFVLSFKNASFKAVVESNQVNMERLSNRGVTAFVGLENCCRSLGKGYFDLVTFFQSIEHIANFREVLEQAYDLIAYGGTIILTAPSIDSIQKQERNTGLADMPPNHVNRWSEKAIKKVLNDVGFSVTDYRLIRGSFYMSLLGQSLQKIQARAYNPKSIFYKIYKIKNRKIRRMILSLFIPVGLLLNLRFYFDRADAGSFIVVAEKVSRASSANE